MLKPTTVGIQIMNGSCMQIMESITTTSGVDLELKLFRSNLRFHNAFWCDKVLAALGTTGSNIQ